MNATHASEHGTTVHIAKGMTLRNLSLNLFYSLELSSFNDRLNVQSCIPDNCLEPVLSYALERVVLWKYGI